MCETALRLSRQRLDNLLNFSNCDDHFVDSQRQTPQVRLAVGRCLLPLGPSCLLLLVCCNISCRLWSVFLFLLLIEPSLTGVEVRILGSPNSSMRVIRNFGAHFANTPPATCHLDAIS